MKFSIGDKVIDKQCIAADSGYTIMQVVGVLDQALLVIEWGTGYDGELSHYDFLDDEKPGSAYWRKAVKRYLEEDLYTPEEALIEIHKLEEAKSELDLEFEAVQYQLQAKLNSATFLVQEAVDIAKRHNKTLCDLKQDCIPLYHALEKGGWSHSHMSC